MHKSIFSYNITRPYPFKWFTPVTAIGGLIAVVLVSFINFTTSGYELVSTSSSNPNRTVGDSTWHGNINWPSYFVQNSQATCASTTLPVNIEVFTNNHAIPYTLSSVWRVKGTKKDYLGSLVYHNNLLRDCNVTQVDIQVLGKFTQSPLNTARTGVGLLLKPRATCAVDVDTLTTDLDSSSGPTFLNLVGSYDFGDDEIPRFLRRNESIRASLYWGESLLRAYWVIVADAWHGSAGKVKDNQFYAEIILKRRARGSNGTRGEVLSDSFFSIDCFTETTFCKNHSESVSWLSEGGHDRDPYPGIWRRIDTLGKAMWFTVMTDLGQNISVDGTPNMLVYDDLLQGLTSNLTNEYRYWNQTKSQHHAYAVPYIKGLAMKSFNASDSPQPGLGASPSYLSTNYFCQVPKAKSAGALFFSVLIADLVLLQALWTGFKFIVDSVVEKRHPSMRYCEGCYENARRDVGGESLTAPCIAGVPNGIATRLVEATEVT
jgi:hypothetical protein